MPRSDRVPSYVVIATLVLVLSGIGLALYQSIAAERSARDEVQHTTTVLNLLRDSLRLGLDAETGQRGFLLTGDLRYLEPFETAQRDWMPSIETLAEALEDGGHPSQVANVDRMRSLGQRKLEELSETVSLAQNGDLQAALALVETNRGLRLMDGFRKTVAEMEYVERAKFAAALHGAEVVSARTLPILTFLGIGVVALVLLELMLERRAARAEASMRDTEALRAAHERSELLARELNHRVKNLFAVIGSIVSLSARGAEDVPSLVTKIRDRINALAVAHAVSQGSLDQKVVGLNDVITSTLRPYMDHAERVVIDGPTVELPVRVVTPIGLMIHELATNAAKYGALSVPSGKVSVRWRRADDGQVELEWKERGGPPVGVEGEPGFGSMMMRQAAVQLGGEVERHFHAEGLVACLSFNVS